MRTSHIPQQQERLLLRVPRLARFAGRHFKHKLDVFDFYRVSPVGVEELKELQQIVLCNRRLQLQRELRKYFYYCITACVASVFVLLY